MGLENLMIAIDKVVKKLPQIYVVVAGEGPLKSDLKALIRSLNLEKFVKIAGFIPDNELPDYYRMADLFILPTKELEGFGLITLEAMSTGLPVLGTPVGGTREILSQFDQRFLFKDTDPESMASLILDICHQMKKRPQEWRTLSHRCRQFVEQNYCWEKNIIALEKVFFEKQTKIPKSAYKN
jgi:glycosyltransferase involved in cell wall biosynthesis